MRRPFYKFRLSVILLSVFSILTPPLGSISANAPSDLSGDWIGTIETAGFWGSMRLSLTHDGGRWDGESRFNAGGLELSSPVRDLKLNGAAVSFLTNVQVMDVHFTFSFYGTHYGNKLSGRLSAARKDGPVTTGSWDLRLQKNTNASQNTIELPPPTGRYAVGRTSLHWRDSSRQEAMTDDPRDIREVMVQLWYPAQHTPGVSPAAYFPDLESLRAAFTDAEQATLASVLTHAAIDARIATAREPFPVAVFSPGGGMSSSFYTAIIEELASQGYIVAAINHPYESLGVVFPDKRVAAYDERQVKDVLRFARERIEVRAADASFVVDQLARLNANDGQFRGRINLARIGIFGHSRGGLAAAMTCRQDRRFRACLNMDGGTLGGPFYSGADEGGPQQPFMWIIRYKPEPSDQQLSDWKMTRQQWEQNWERIQSRVNSLFQRIRGGAYRVMLKGATHESFSDLPLLSSRQELGSLAYHIRITHTVRAYVSAFFDRYLAGSTAALLNGSSTDYPEITLERFEPLEQK